MARKQWTDFEKRQLEQLYPDNYTAEIAKGMGRSVTSVYGMANIMGLAKSQAFIQKELQRQGNRLREAGKATQIKKGNIPVNKGKPVPKEVIAKLKPTMFKKGGTPHNTKHDGYERVNVYGYVEVRLSQGKFVHKHRHVWEQANGPIPEGHVLVFKDGNKLNVCIENLELITRKQNMQRNTIARYPTELKQTIKLLKKLKRKIDEKQN